MSKSQVTGLRMLADLIEANPEIGKTFAYSLRDITAYSLPHDNEEKKKFLAQMIRIFKDAGFSIEKKYDNTTFQLVCDAPVSEDERGTYDSFGVRFYATRESVCTPRVVGQKTATKKVMPPRETWDEETVTEDIIEWDCSPILGND